MIDIEIPKLIDGGKVFDDRGSLSFFNDASFINLKRFYIVENHSSKFIRAWHGHKKEEKFVFVVSGAAKIASVKVDNWDSPSRDLEINSYILTDEKPNLLWIPKGYANGCMTLKANTKVIYFSSSSLDESLNDDYRFDSKYWNCWDIKER